MILGRIKFKLFEYLLADMCKQNDCSKCSFVEKYINNVPVRCKRRDTILIDEAKKAWIKQ